MNHQELIDQWKEDCAIDSLHLESELYKIPILHAKYLEILLSMKTKVRSLMHKYYALRQLKTRYFNGELGKEELEQYGWRQYQYNKPTKTALESMLEADQDLQVQLEKVEYHKIMVETAESIMKEISSRNFHIRAAIEIRKLEAGL